VIAAFLTGHPHVKLDLVVSDAPIDIVEGGFDAGIQLGERIDRGMVAVPVTGDIRMAVVGAPAYFARRPTPTHPRDLVEHDCLNWHAAPSSPRTAGSSRSRGRTATARGAGREIVVAVPARVLSTDSAIRIRLARAGLGLTIVYEDEVRARTSPAGRSCRCWRRSAGPSRATTCTTRSAGTPHPHSGRSSTTCGARGSRRPGGRRPEGRCPRALHRVPPARPHHSPELPRRARPGDRRDAVHLEGK
jgi:hypothetical protein